MPGAQKNGLDMQYSGRRPPPQVRGTGIPQEVQLLTTLGYKYFYGFPIKYFGKAFKVINCYVLL